MKDSAARRVVVRDLTNENPTEQQNEVSDERALRARRGRRDSPVVTGDDDSTSSSLLSIEDLVGGLDSLLQDDKKKSSFSERGRPELKTRSLG